MKNHSSILLILALLTLWVAPSFAADPPPEANQPGQKRVVATMDADGVQRVEVTGGEYYFEPSQIVVRVNQPVELKVRKTGGFIPHNIIVKAPEAGINFNVGLGDKFQAIRFTATKTGKYAIYCDKRFLWFQTHQEKGMEGTIEVVE